MSQRVKQLTLFKTIVKKEPIFPKPKTIYEEFVNSKWENHNGFKKQEFISEVNKEWNQFSKYEREHRELCIGITETTDEITARPSNTDHLTGFFIRNPKEVRY